VFLYPKRRHDQSVPTAILPGQPPRHASFAAEACSVPSKDTCRERQRSCNHCDRISEEGRNELLSVPVFQAEYQAATLRLTTHQLLWIELVTLN
jgi:hypothetical protein